MKKTLQFLGFKKTKTRKKFDYYFMKGFTLVEIIGAIVLLTVIGLIIYPVINNLISDSKDDLYKKQIEELERISNTWVAKNYKKLKLEAGYSYNLSFEELKEAGLISEQHIKNPKTGELLEGCITLSYNSENKNYDIKYAPECQAYGETKHPTIVLSTNSGVINGYGYATSNFDVVVSGSNITSYMYCKGEYECEPDTKVESSSGIIPISNNGTTYVCAIGTNEFMSSEKVCKVYKLDKTKPEEGELVIDGTLGENGWYVSDVKLSVRDVEGVTSTLNITEITRDTSGTEIIMTSKNNKTGAVKVTNYTVKVDKTKPTVGELVINGTKGNNGWYKSDVVFSVTNGSDTLSGHASTTSSISSITKDTKGTKVTLTTKDKAGNTSTKEYTIKMDKTAPTTPTSMNFVFGNWSQYTDNTWTNQSIYAASTTSNPGPSGSSDTTSGLWKYQISTDNVNWVDYNYTASGIYLMSTDGVHTRYFRAVDNAGNISSIISRTAKVDKTAPTVPTVTYNGGSNSCSWKNNYNLTLNSSDSLSGVRVYQVDWMGDNASNSDVASNFIPWNGYSSCNNRFRAVDNAGNISEWTGVHHIHMDTEKPVHTNWWWGTVNKDIAQLYIQATDNVGISRVQCPTSTATGGYNNWHWFDAVWDSSKNAYRCDITPSTFGHYNQTYTTHLYMYDHAGNGGYYNATNANIPVNERFLRSEILSESIKGSNVTWTTAWQTGNTSGLYSQSTSKGTTYYFRGNPTNNYIKFANKIWRIIRVNEDGTVKIMLNDAVSGDIFNSSTYGFDKMYYSNSNLKNIVNSWYNTNITGTNASKVVTGNYFCEAAKLMYFSGSVGNFSVPVKENYTPNFECATDGNGKGLVTASVGLITYDEIAFAGGWYYDFSLSYPYYLNNANLADRARWTMSPAGNNSDSSYALAFIIYNGGAWHTAVSSGSLISPVVNLKGDIAITGSGTSSDPYVPKN